MRLFQDDLTCQDDGCEPYSFARVRFSCFLPTQTACILASFRFSCHVQYCFSLNIILYIYTLLAAGGSGRMVSASLASCTVLFDSFWVCLHLVAAFFCFLSLFFLSCNHLPLVFERSLRSSVIDCVSTIFIHPAREIRQPCRNKVCWIAL